jgi:hypothetical protein
MQRKSRPATALDRRHRTRGLADLHSLASPAAARPPTTGSNWRGGLESSPCCHAAAGGQAGGPGRAGSPAAACRVRAAPRALSSSLGLHPALPNPSHPPKGACAPRAGRQGRVQSPACRCAAAQHARRAAPVPLLGSATPVTVPTKASNVRATGHERARLDALHTCHKSISALDREHSAAGSSLVSFNSTFRFLMTTLDGKPR